MSEDVIYESDHTVFYTLIHMLTILYSHITTNIKKVQLQEHLAFALLHRSSLSDYYAFICLSHRITCTLYLEVQE